MQFNKIDKSTEVSRKYYDSPDEQIWLMNLNNVVTGRHGTLFKTVTRSGTSYCHQASTGISCRVPNSDVWQWGILPTPVIHKNVAYYRAHSDAVSVLNWLRAIGLAPDTGRIVDYTRGYAIQRHKSGAYWSGAAWE